MTERKSPQREEMEVERLERVLAKRREKVVTAERNLMAARERLEQARKVAHA
jgi:hypothetical protein